MTVLIYPTTRLDNDGRWESTDGSLFGGVSNGSFDFSPETPQSPTGPVDLARELGQGVARSVASVGLTVMNPILRATGQQGLNLRPEDYGAFPKLLFGSQPVQDIPTRIGRFQEEHPRLSGPSGSLAPLAVVGGTLLDLLPSGKG